MKLFILSLLIPCQIYCFQDCEEKIKEELKLTVCEMIPYFTREKSIDPEFYYLYGAYIAYNNMLALIGE